MGGSWLITSQLGVESRSENSCGKKKSIWYKTKLVVPAIDLER